jgi:hypothetical protein
VSVRLPDTGQSRTMSGMYGCPVVPLLMIERDRTGHVLREMSCPSRDKSGTCPGTSSYVPLHSRTSQTCSFQIRTKPLA